MVGRVHHSSRKNSLRRLLGATNWRSASYLVEHQPLYVLELFQTHCTSLMTLCRVHVSPRRIYLLLCMGLTSMIQGKLLQLHQYDQPRRVRHVKDVDRRAAGGRRRRRERYSFLVSGSGMSWYALPAWIIGHVLSGWDGTNPLQNPTNLFYQMCDT